MKIYDCDYWKERCYGLSALTLIDRAIELDHVGGAYSGVFRPTQFICLILKMLQIGPDKETVLEFIHNDDYKYSSIHCLDCRYVTALGMFYLRLTGTSKEIYTELEPYYSDYRKLRLLTPDGWSIIHMDEFVDMLLEKDMALNIALPHLDKRHTLVDRGELEPRQSILEDELNDLIKETEKEDSEKSVKRDLPEEKGGEKKVKTTYSVC